MAGLADAEILQKAAVPAVCLLVAFLGYFSQYVFHSDHLAPGPPSTTETVVFNLLLLALWYTYARVVTVDPGRYVHDTPSLSGQSSPSQQQQQPGYDERKGKNRRWCGKCAAPKPPRAHHCRHCRRCIPKMDHHCPWTANCVSMTTFPHFIRFLVYTNASLAVLGHLLVRRAAALWRDRLLPAYLGPSISSLAALSLIGLVYMPTAFALLIMLLTTLKSWLLNQTTIEVCEQERHDAVMARRGSRDWWDIVGPDGEGLRLEKVEFPYDIGFFANMAQAMGTKLFFLWLSPFAGHPRVSPAPGSGSGKGDTTGWKWEENGFNREEGMWPPPDPEKMRRATTTRPWLRQNDETAMHHEAALTPEERTRAFRERQEQDFRRRRRALVDELEENQGYVGVVAGEEDYSDHKGAEVPPKWTDEDDVEQFADLGVDDDDSADGDDDVPLGKLIRRRRARLADDDD